MADALMGRYERQVSRVSLLLSLASRNKRARRLIAIKENIKQSYSSLAHLRRSHFNRKVVATATRVVAAVQVIVVEVAVGVV